MDVTAEWAYGMYDSSFTLDQVVGMGLSRDHRELVYHKANYSFSPSGVRRAHIVHSPVVIEQVTYDNTP